MSDDDKMSNKQAAGCKKATDGTDEGHSHLADHGKRARALWLAPNPDLKEVENLYRQALAPVSALLLRQKSNPSEPPSDTKKRKRNEHPNGASKLSEEQQLVVEKLCMVLCQSGRALEAKEWLEPLGFTCRLASCVLDYPTTASISTHTSSQQNTTTNNNEKLPKKHAQPPCCIYDQFLSESELQHLRHVFQDPHSSYWVDHNYQVEPPSPYFSYIIPLLQRQSQQNGKGITSKVVADTYGVLGCIVSKIYQLLMHRFPQLTTATAVEMWAHNRPHPTGHQLHFDSDNEGMGGMIRNPIISTILYLSPDSSAGGPSMITRQTLTSRHLARKAWLSNASQPGRLVAFDGRVLHGVLPGKGTHNGSRRVTLMLAFWTRIRVRPGELPGAARPFPVADTKVETSNECENMTKTTNASNDAHPLWSRLLIQPQENSEDDGGGPVEQEPIVLDRVYETLDGDPWTKAMGFPEYDQVFQGF